MKNETQLNATIDSEVCRTHKVAAKLAGSTIEQTTEAALRCSVNPSRSLQRLNLALRPRPAKAQTESHQRMMATPVAPAPPLFTDARAPEPPAPYCGPFSPVVPALLVFA